MFVPKPAAIGRRHILFSLHYLNYLLFRKSKTTHTSFGRGSVGIQFLGLAEIIRDGGIDGAI